MSDATRRPAGPDRLRSMDVNLLRAMRDLCPKVAGETRTFSAFGESFELTLVSRKRLDAELARRKASGSQS